MFWVEIFSLIFTTDGLMQSLLPVLSFLFFYFLHTIHLVKLTNIRLINSSHVSQNFLYSVLIFTGLHTNYKKWYFAQGFLSLSDCDALLESILEVMENILSSFHQHVWLKLIDGGISFYEPLQRFWSFFS